MKLIHEERGFDALIDIAAQAGPLRSAAMVEKDYWICHALWSLERSGIRMWFKGGTSLSKAFSLIQRFSEDIDLVVLEGRIAGLPHVGSWKREDAGPSARRRAFWEALLPAISIPGCEMVLDAEHDPTYRGPGYYVHYPAVRRPGPGHADEVLRPFVLLEMSHGSNARSAVAPSVPLPISSAVHDQLLALGRLDQYVDNRPRAIECVHPYVTLIEKLDAITRRYERSDDRFSAASFARHYEDAARIILGEADLPPIPGTVEELARTMLHDQQVRRLVHADEPAFALRDDERRRQLERGYNAIAPMFWGERLSLDQATQHIREWLGRHRFTGT